VKHGIIVLSTDIAQQCMGMDENAFYEWGASAADTTLVLVLPPGIK
jgi:hypothetical protein